MTDTVRAPAAATAQGPRMVVQQDSSNSPEHKATNGNAQAAIDWRKHLAVHPAAEAFPLLSEKELRELASDIKRNGLRSDFVLWRPDDKTRPVLLDGRNRLDALAILGKLALNGPELCVKRADGSLRQVKSFKTITGGDPEKLAYSLNLHRRHLTPKRKRELIVRLLKAKPEVSDRHIAEQAKSNRTTVGQIRKTLEKTGDVSIVDTRTDTKGRTQPARKGWSRERYRRHRASKRGTAEPRLLFSKQQQIANAKPVAELLDAAVEVQEHNATLTEKLRAAEIKIAGLKSEVEALKAENTKLREQLDAAQKVASS